VDYSIGRPTQVEAPRQAKLVEERDHWLKPTSSRNRYSVLLLEQIAKLQYGIQALAGNQAKIQPKLQKLVEQSQNL
jgi:hypothetical protein